VLKFRVLRFAFVSCVCLEQAGRVDRALWRGSDGLSRGRPLWRLGTAYRETDIERTDLEIVITI